MSAPEFVKELEIFHFREKIFHRNDSKGKFATHRALLKVNFEYTDDVDKEEEASREKQEEAILENITELEKAIAQETHNPG